MRRFFTMPAHLKGQVFNASQLGQALGGASHTTIVRYLDTLVDTMLVRRLTPHLASVGKRLVKSPKVCVRDSGSSHALLGLGPDHDPQGHPVAGASCEGFVVEQAAAALPTDAQMGFYRTAAGAQLDVAGRRRFGCCARRPTASGLRRSFVPRPCR